MPDFQPPPTWADVVITDRGKSKFNPVWLKWFIDLVGTLNTGGGAVLSHNSLDSIQGGSATERYHLTQAQHDGLATTLSGTYSPTLANVLNLDGSTAYQAQYLRVGDVVVVSGKVSVNPTAAGSTQLGIPLPIASNLGTAEECSGAAFSPTIAGQGAAIVGDPANNRAQMEWIAADTTDQPMHFVFSYLIT